MAWNPGVGRDSSGYQTNHPSHGGGGNGGGDGPPSVIHKPKGPTAAEIAAAKAKAEAEKRRLEVEARKKHLIDFKDTQNEKIKKFKELVDIKGYDSTIATDEEKKLYDDWYTATGKKEKITHPLLVNSEVTENFQEKDGKTKTFITDKSSIEDLITGNINKETYIETPELGSVTTFLNPENAIGPKSWAVNPGKPRFTIEELQAKGFKNGGILDITGDEQITTDEGNDISLVDESETGVSTLFRAKNGGNATKNIKGQPHMLAYITPGEAKTLENLGGQKTMTKEGIPAYPPSDNYGGDWGGSSNNDKGETSSDSGWSPGVSHSGSPPSTPDTGGHSRFEPGSGYYGEPVTGTTENISGGDIWDWDDTSEKDDVIETYNNVKDRYDRNKTKQNWKMVVSVLSGDIFGVVKNAYGMSKDKKAYEEMLNKLQQDAIDLGIPTHSPHTDTLPQIIGQELIDINPPPRDDDDTGGDDGPEAPVVAPVTEEIEDSYARAGNWLQGYRDLKAKQALSASLQEKWADEREWQQETMFANSGGLANLFRVKNQ